jgi:hypothetical protein
MINDSNTMYQLVNYNTPIARSEVIELIINVRQCYRYWLSVNHRHEHNVCSISTLYKQMTHTAVLRYVTLR